MRDPKRIESVLDQIREIWEQVPDWRLGQLIVNAVKPGEPCPEVFYIEDTKLEHKLAELKEQILDSKRDD